MAVTPARRPHVVRHSKRPSQQASFVAEKVLIVAAAVAVVAFGYLVYGIVTRSLLAFPFIPGTDSKLGAAQAQQVVANVSTACQVLNFALVIATLAAFVRFFASSSAAWTVTAVGLGLYFGFPWLVGDLLQQNHLDHNQLTQTMLISLAQVAKGLTLVGVVWLVGVVAYQVISNPRERYKSAPKAARPSSGGHSLLRNCWELTHCTGTTRNICPSYRERKSCWKRHQGCFCDTSLFDRMTDGANSWVTNETHETHQSAMHLRRSGRRPCTVCPLYEEHQYYKYRAICWIAYPATAALVFFGMPVFGRSLNNSLNRVDQWVANLSYMPTKASQSVIRIASDSPLQYFLLGCIALLILGYTLQFIEYLIFQKKL